MKIHLITCTGDRPEAFALCCRWVERWRKYRSDLHWLIIDDGAEPSSRPSWADYHHIKRPNVQGHTLALNLSTALRNIEAKPKDAIFFIEDDDYYGSAFLAGLLSKLLLGFDAVGQSRARYYNVASRQHRIFENRSHASLAQMAIRYESCWLLADRITQQSVQQQRTDIDIQFWQEAYALNLRTFLFPETFSFVGIKGMAGRAGIGKGHRPGSGWQTDSAELSTLQQWIGNAADFETYRGIIRGA